MVKPGLGNLSPNAPSEPYRPEVLATQRHMRGSVFGGYLLGAAQMLAAAAIAARFAFPAERKPLESVARPLNAVD